MAVYRASQNFQALYIQGNKVARVDRDYAEFYFDNNSTAQVIETANTPICCRYGTEGELDGFTYAAGSTGAITAYSDAGGGQVNVASAGHNLNDGDIVSIRGTTNYNGIFAITYVDANNFEITTTWAVDDGASDWDSPDCLVVGADAAGEYIILWSISASENGAAGSTVVFAAYSNTTMLSDSVSSTLFANNDSRSVSGNAVANLLAGDKLFLTVQSDGTNDITVSYGNFTAHRL